MAQKDLLYHLSSGLFLLGRSQVPLYSYFMRGLERVRKTLCCSGQEKVRKTLCCSQKGWGIRSVGGKTLLAWSGWMKPPKNHGDGLSKKGYCYDTYGNHAGVTRKYSVSTSGSKATI